MDTPDDPDQNLKGIDPADLLARGLESGKGRPGTGNPRAWVPPAPEVLALLLPQYRIERLIGHGGMGAVYQGIQAGLDRPVAVKLLPAEFVADEQFFTRFQREAKVLARLQHSGIVAIYEFGLTTDGHPYFVMEFVDGTDLARLIGTQSLTTGQALELTIQICDALNYAHGQGVIHRDIKPANILVTKDGRAKVADFGLARPTEDEGAGRLTRSNVIMGTPAYMAPEQYMGMSDQRADIYALGVMLYEMLTGKRPEGAFDPPSVKVRLDVRLDQVVLKAMRQEPERRYQLASEMGSEVDHIRKTPPPRANAGGKPVATRGNRKKPAKVPPLGIAAAIVFPLLALGGLIGWLEMGAKPAKSGEAPGAIQASLVVAPPADPMDGLVSCWKADGDARDSVGNNHGTLHGDVSFTDGPFGKAFLVNGGFVEVPDSPNLRFAPEVPATMTVWAYRSTSAPIVHIFGKRIGCNGDASSGNYQLGIDRSLPATPLNEWVFWSVVNNGDFVSLYINGKWARNWPRFGPVNNVPLKIGGSGDCNVFHGMIDDFRIYNRAMSADEIRAMYEAQQPTVKGAMKAIVPTPPAPAIAATKDKPFENSLGMKFVPVPIGGGPTAGERVLFSIWDTRVQDYLAFARENNKVDGRWQEQQKDGVPVGRELDHPVVGVNWEDAQAFCRWLTAKETAEGKLPPGMQYRLPSDEEWSWAVGLPSEPGAVPAEKSGKNGADFPWGIGSLLTGKVANYVDDAFHAKFPKQKAGNGEAKKHQEAKDWFVGYDDGYATTSPVGSFPANAHGLYDMGGNVWQWCEDWFSGDQKERVLRGGSWACGGRLTLLSSYRKNCEPGTRGFDNGFRCVLAASASPRLLVSKFVSPSSASKESPFVNTLGMKFVPVPITGGPTDGKALLFSIWETRVQDYKIFATETKREWPKPDFEQGPTHPAVNVSWEDAQAFCVWLTQSERKLGKLSDMELYRLPSDHEWSCAVGIGDLENPNTPASEKHAKIEAVWPWGRQWPPPAGVGNFADEAAKDTARSAGLATGYMPGYNDGFAYTSPADSFPANQHGLYDMTGNVWQWCEESFGERKKHPLRGSAWDCGGPKLLLASNRNFWPTNSRYNNHGFRVVRVSETKLDSARQQGAVTKAQPFENSLGMKFVPVPITGGPTDGKELLFCVWITRVKDFTVFVDSTGHEATKLMTSMEIEKDGTTSWKEVGRTWKEPGFAQTGEHPVVGVSWEDAKAFCAWLTANEQRTGKLPAGWVYRLPSDHEWSCAAGIGNLEDPNKTPRKKDGKIADIYPWGAQWPPPKGAGNFAGRETSSGMAKSWLFLTAYDDGYPRTSPVGVFNVGRYGLYDMGGNVAQFCEDLIGDPRPVRTLRGSPWDVSSGSALLLSQRWCLSADRGFGSMGFRCVLSPPAAVPSLPSATKDQPFMNTLGMKFVPVPGSEILMCIHETRRADYTLYAGTNPAVDRSWMTAEKDGAPVGDGDTHPVVKVNWADAKAFCEWLSKKEGRSYRLPTDREWSLAVGIGDREDPAATPESLGSRNLEQFPWGTGWPPPKGVGNYGDSTFIAKFPPGQTIDGSGYGSKDYTDGYATTAPVMSFSPNRLGFYDLGGNVWEWCEDWRSDEQKERSVRGGSWGNGERAHIVSSRRHRYGAGARSVIGGFRCVLVGTSEKIAAPPKSVITPVKTPYRDRNGITVDRFAWKGTHVALLSASGDLDPQVMSKIVGTLDNVYVFYQEITGREPQKTADSGGYAITVEDDTSPTGWRTLIGTAMIWMKTGSFRGFFTAVAERDEYSSLWFREFGLNSWYYDRQLAPKDVEIGKAFCDGYVVFMGSAACEKLGIDFAPWQGRDARDLTHGIEQMLDLYLADPSLNLENTLGARKAPANPMGLGAGELFASFCVRLCKDHGGIAYNSKLWREVAKRPEAKTAQDSIDNFILAACAAANKNLTTLFTRHWRWPMSDKAIQEAKQRWGAITGAATPPPTEPSAVAATKDQPFENSLGMKFVPVPGTDVLFSIWDTRVQDFKEYAEAKKVDDSWLKQNREGVPSGHEPDHPVVGVSWEDAKAFCQWLTEKEIAGGRLSEGMRYRLPTDGEWSFAVGLPPEAGATPAEKNGKDSVSFPWGKDYPPKATSGNYADSAWHEKFSKETWIEGYADGYATTSPVGSFPANAYGLYDMGGNVWQWCEDWFDGSHRLRVLRGASWLDGGDPSYLLSSFRWHEPPGLRYYHYGFRCVLSGISTSGKSASSANPADFTTTSANGQITITGYTGPGGHVDIPATINGLPVVAIEHAFYDKPKIISVTIPEGITRIGDRAFLGTHLTSVKIPESVTTIGWQAFCNTPLTSVTIPDNVTRIENQAFCWCKNLTSVTIGKSVNLIGFWAFAGCTSLSSVTIPDSVTTIDHSFGGSTSLASITVSAQNPSFSSVDGVLFNKDQTTLLEYPAGKAGSSYTIPDSVTSIANEAFGIANGAFNNGKNLASVIIPQSVTSIGDGAFSRCVGLTEIRVSEQNPAYRTVDGMVFSRDQRKLVAYPAGKEGRSFTIPSGVTSIGGFAFNGCEILTSVTIPDSVTTIEKYAFYGCKGLASVAIPYGVTSLGDWAFASCASLTGVTIPGSVIIIGGGAFLECNNLASVVFEGNAPTMGNDVFANTKGGFTIRYRPGATGFSSPVWTTPSGEQYPATTAAPSM